MNNFIFQRHGQRHGQDKFVVIVLTVFIVFFVSSPLPTVLFTFFLFRCYGNNARISR